jgi:ABC-type glycerol-3-phosphate transport system substrate-binding protein
VNLEEIKSPLPSREILTPEPDEEFERIKELDPVETTPIDNNIPTPPPKPTNFIQKIGTKKLMIFGGIGLGIILILSLIFGVIIPSLSKKNTEIITINYWGLWEENSIMNSTIADFESKNPGIKINYKMNQKTDYRSRLVGRLEKTNEAEDVPDIYRIHNSWLPMFKSYLAPVPTETTNKLEMETDFFDTYKNTLKENGKFMAVPLMYDGLSLFYNKDLIEAGQVELPKSWWDLKSAATKLTVKDSDGKIQVAGVAMGLTDNVDQWSDILGLMMKQNGVNPLSNDPIEVKKLQDILTFYTIFRTGDHVWDESLPNSTQLFASGKLAFYFGPSWRVFNIKDINPNLRYGITTAPQLPTLDSLSQNQSSSNTQLTNIHWSSYWIEGVNNKSKHQKEAWKFLEYLASKEGLEKMYTASSQTREFGEIYPRKSLAEKVTNNEKINPFVSVANNATSWYLSSRTFDNGLNDAMIKYFGDAINSIALKNQTIEDVMPTLQSGINQTKTTYQLK